MSHIPKHLNSYKILISCQKMTEIERLKNYLREINVFSGSPVFERTKEEFICVDPKGEWDEYYMTYPYWQNRQVEFHESEFERILQKFEKLIFDTSKQNPTSDSLMTRAIDRIPDSSDTLLIEFGSEYGTRGAGYIAAHKPKIKAILIDKGWDNKGNPKYLFEPDAHHYNHDLRFTQGIEFLSELDLERRINGIYNTNGIHNVTFKQMKISENNYAEFLRGQTKGKKVYLIGVRAPVILPFIMANMYNEFNAEAMFLEPTALEKIEPDMFPWKIVQEELDLTNNETQGYIKSVFDPNVLENQCSPPKYDYEDPSQRRVGTSIKLGICLAIAKKVSGSVYMNVEEDIPRMYNQADHFVIAQR